MGRKGIFIAATGQNVGKTTICLGMIAMLKKRYPKLGFMKPVGQQHVTVDDCMLVDKDVVLFKEHFSLPDKYSDMSPVIFPRGFTRDFLDGKIATSDLEKNIDRSYKSISEANDFTIVEGTGHVGVGSIVDLNNAKVAKQLGLDCVIIAKGGLGSAFDELCLNKTLCDQMGVQVAGVILNRVLDSKREMVTSYIQKALDRWKIPLIGAIPYNQLLSTPSMEDFESLFKTKMLSGQKYHYRHFGHPRLVATSAPTFKEMTEPDQLLVTPATREDIVYALLELHKPGEPQQGFIFTGKHAPSSSIIEALQKADIPSLYAPFPTFETMHMISSFVAKIDGRDQEKVEMAIQLVENHLQFI
ncbi:MAG: Phosphate acetyltransferase [Chlamydiales bacterium]|nr:Phosphate acetyltransferase [Chlamydiales bacterium]MCH9635183.1 Phosphate acetyltransferase [Chlamydiales bacterium]MCH9704263.1 AAA family ATPase [Chlamydiota bacterium]